MFAKCHYRGQLRSEWVHIAGPNRGLTFKQVAEPHAPQVGGQWHRVDPVGESVRHRRSTIPRARPIGDQQQVAEGAEGAEMLVGRRRVSEVVHRWLEYAGADLRILLVEVEPRWRIRPAGSSLGEFELPLARARPELEASWAVDKLGATVGWRRAARNGLWDALAGTSLNPPSARWLPLAGLRFIARP